MFFFFLKPRFIVNYFIADIILIVRYIIHIYNVVIVYRATRVGDFAAQRDGHGPAVINRRFFEPRAKG